MASWQELKGHIASNYKIADDQGSFLKLIFGVNGDRSQVVFVHHISNNSGEQWAAVESPIGPVAKVSLPDALEAISETVCGGLSRIGDLLTVRDSFPLANLDINEFEAPLHHVIGIADGLEAQFAGGDEY